MRLTAPVWWYGLCAASLLALSNGFVLQPTLPSISNRHQPVPTVGPPSSSSSSSSSSSLTILRAALPGMEDMESARTAFFIWFFGASGAAGIARSAFPRMYDSFRAIQELKGQGPTLGGPSLGIPLLLTGYPEDLSTANVQQVLNNPLSVDQMVQKYPVADNFWSEKGYLTFQAFSQANAKCNPLTVRAIFDTFATSTNTVEPAVAQDKLDLYKQDLSSLKQGLIASKLVSYSAIATLLFLLGLADVTAAGHAYHGWFPEWPGAVDFPWSILDSEKGLATIPQYWMSDVPTE